MYDPALMASIAEADEKINQKKYQKSELASGFDDSNQAFINSINELTCSDIFSKKLNLDEPANSQGHKKEESKPVTCSAGQATIRRATMG